MLRNKLQEAYPNLNRMAEILNRATELYSQLVMEWDFHHPPYRDFWDWVGFVDEVSFRCNFEGGPGYLASAEDKILVNSYRGYLVTDISEAYKYE
jgi:hypothetical protein